MKASTFTRGILLGAGFMYLMDPSEDGRRGALVRDRGARTLPRPIQYLAGALGAVALVYGASRALRMRGESHEASPLAPNYAYLR